jgi:hypothetical protein
MMCSTQSLQNTPLRAPLGAARQALLASPSRGEVYPVGSAPWCKALDVTLPLEGRVAKLTLKGRSEAREGGAASISQ